MAAADRQGEGCGVPLTPRPVRPSHHAVCLVQVRTDATKRMVFAQAPRVLTLQMKVRARMWLYY